MEFRLEDKISVPTKRIVTDSGQLIVPCAIARTGIQHYLGAEIGVADKEFVEVHRESSEVFSEKSLSSYRSAPVTIDHPEVSVTSHNAKELQVGVLEGIPVRDDDLLRGTVVIARQDAIDAIEEGNVDLSVGYSCEIVLRDGKYFQENIKANHIAIVAKGRAGKRCSLSDKQIENFKKEDVNMELKDALIKIGELEEKLKTIEAKVIADAAIADGVLAKYDASVVKVTDSEANYKKLEDSMDALVIDRCNLVTKATELTDKDLTGLSVKEIKQLIVKDSVKIDLADKSDSYIDARFDILMEDASSSSAMSKVLNDAAKIPVDKPTASIVDIARANKAARDANRGVQPAEVK